MSGILLSPNIDHQLLIQQVVLEGIWKEGFMALAAVGATNIGSIELFIEPELRTNKPKKKLFPTEPPEERVYDPEGLGLRLEKGKEVRVGSKERIKIPV
jgi:phosphatidylserine decarboxylase